MVALPVGLAGATEGHDFEDAVRMAADWLKETALGCLMAEDEWPDLPLGTDACRGGRMVTIAVETSLEQVPAMTSAEAANQHRRDSASQQLARRMDGAVMGTAALRYAENFAPEYGTIAAHQDVIKREGSVWYGKFGSPISALVAGELLKTDDPRILLIRSGGTGFECASKDVMSRFVVVSSGRTLSHASRHCMNPYFIINYDGSFT